MSLFRSETDDLFGGLDGVDADLDSLESEVEAISGGAASYGADDLFSHYGAGTALVTDRGDDAGSRIEVPAGLEVALGQAFNPGFLQKMPRFVEWARSFFPDFIVDQTYISGKGSKEARDMAHQFVTQVYTMQNGDRVSAADWGQLSADEKVDFVNQVVGSSVFLNHLDSYDQMTEAWDKVLKADGWWEKLKAAGSGWWDTAKAWWTDDIWTAIKGVLPWSDEQNLNETALVYFVGHKAWAAANWASPSAGSAASGMDPYPKIIAQIDAAYASVGGFTPTADAPTERTVVVDVPTPPTGGYADESIPAGEAGFFPRPETILAFGYTLAALPTLLKAL